MSRHRGGTPGEIRRDNQRLRNCETQLVDALTENEELKQRNKELVARTIRQAADLARLRKAVLDARPKVLVVDTDLVRPFAPVVELPYVPAVAARDTSNDDTQQLPLLDLPRAA